MAAGHQACGLGGEPKGGTVGDRGNSSKLPQFCETNGLSPQDLPAPEPQAPCRVKLFSTRIKEVHISGCRPTSTEEGKRRGNATVLLECSQPISLTYQQTPTGLLLLIPGLFRVWRNNLEAHRQSFTVPRLLEASQCCSPHSHQHFTMQAPLQLLGTCAMLVSRATGEEAMPEVQLRPGTPAYQVPTSSLSQASQGMNEDSFGSHV